MSLLERLASPSELHAMPMDERLLATLYVAILGMGITFLVLVFLQYCIKLMSLLVRRGTRKSEVTVAEANVSLEKPLPAEFTETDPDEELIAVLTAAVAACLGRPADRFVVRNVRQAQDIAPSWARAGLSEQLAMRKTH